MRFRSILPALATAFLITGCAAQGAARPEASPAPVPPAQGTCGAEKVSSFVGAVASDEVLAKIKSASGAQACRSECALDGGEGIFAGCELLQHSLDRSEGFRVRLNELLAQSQQPQEHYLSGSMGSFSSLSGTDGKAQPPGSPASGE